MQCPRAKRRTHPRQSSVWSARRFWLVPAQSVDPAMRFCPEHAEAELRGLA